jgi:DNA-directed RNA polymerase specialized sigma24 family protein
VIESTQKEWVKLACDEEAGSSPIDIERVQARLLELIYQKLEKLPGGDVLRMSYIEGKSTKQIARELDMTENNVYIIKSRSLKVLRTMLSKSEWMLFVLLFLRP